MKLYATGCFDLGFAALFVCNATCAFGRNVNHCFHPQAARIDCRFAATLRHSCIHRRRILRGLNMPHHLLCEYGGSSDGSLDYVVCRKIAYTHGYLLVAVSVLATACLLFRDTAAQQYACTCNTLGACIFPEEPASSRGGGNKQKS